MSHRFLTYLREERDRLNRWVAGLTLVEEADCAEIALLHMLNRTVEQQINRWACDLASTRTS
jgi:hypothetical protein